MANPQLRPPRQPSDPEQRWMALARVFAGHSADPSIKIGCIAVRQDRLIAHACNGYPRSLDIASLKTKPKDQRARLSIPAETALITRAARDGICLAGSLIYLWPFGTTLQTATLLIEAEVQALVLPGYVLPIRYQEEWPETLSLLIEAGIAVRHLDDTADSL